MPMLIDQGEAGSRSDRYRHRHTRHTDAERYTTRTAQPRTAAHTSKMPTNMFAVCRAKQQHECGLPRNYP
jgi:hypothetical protein